MAEMPGCVERRNPDWNLNQPSLRSGDKLPSASFGRCETEAFCFTCNLHIASHPNHPHQNKNGLLAQSVLFLVETVGIEPMTSCMSSMRSNQLSYASATHDIIAYAEAFVNRF